MIVCGSVWPNGDMVLLMLFLVFILLLLLLFLLILVVVVFLLFMVTFWCLERLWLCDVGFGRVEWW